MCSAIAILPVRVNVVDPVFFAVGLQVGCGIVVHNVPLPALVVGSTKLLGIAWTVDAIGILLETVVVSSVERVIGHLVMCVNINLVVVIYEALAPALRGVVSSIANELALVVIIVVHLDSGVVGHVDRVGINRRIL